MRFRSTTLSLLTGVILMVPVTAHAELALLTNGRSIKVAGWDIDGPDVEFQLRAGGKLRVPILLVERIVDDEIVELEPRPVPGVDPSQRVFPERSWRFDEASAPLFSTSHDATIRDAASKFDVDAALVSAIIKAESNYQVRALSRKGAQGLMQLMPATATRFGVTDSFDPVANIYGGTRYLRWLLDTFDRNADLAVAAYNAGEQNVWKYDGVPPFRETQQYIRRVAGFLQRSEPAAGTVVVAGPR